MRTITYGIVKSDAYDRRDEIKKLIRKTGLYIVSEKPNFHFTTELAKTHYAHLSGEVLRSALDSLTSGPTNPMVIEGSNAITKLRTLAGKDVNPEDCAPGTIRRVFGQGPYKNAFHRSMRAREVGKEIPIVFDQSDLPSYVLDGLWDYPRFATSMFAMGRIKSLTPRFSL